MHNVEKMSSHAGLGNISHGHFVESSEAKDVTGINQQIRYTFMEVLYNGP